MTDITPEFNPETAPPRLTIDWDAYLPFFEDKRELIEALWSIVLNFVDLGFGVHPVQQACGEDISLAEVPIRDVLSLCNTTSEFEQASATSREGPSERSPYASE